MSTGKGSALRFGLPREHETSGQPVSRERHPVDGESSDPIVRVHQDPRVPLRERPVVREDLGVGGVFIYESIAQTARLEPTLDAWNNTEPFSPD